MLFNSLTFLLFFAVVMVVRLAPAPWRLQKLSLLLLSYLFYAAWNPPFVALLWLSTAVDWFAARRIAGSERPAPRRLWLYVSLATNLGVLTFFKYGEFLQHNFVAALQMVGIAFEPAPFSIILPVGISFYTFQTLSYTLDVYRGELDPWDDPFDFALFVSFFPQLVAGPIVRASDFLPQCRARAPIDSGQIGWGLALMVIGLFEKVLLADTALAPAVDTVFSHADSAGWIDAWAGAAAFAGQIYFDFAGYSLVAIGAALCLGFQLPDNFRGPYGAIGFSDFWRRWHISLSTWLRDYLYISMGGNRRSPTRTHFNRTVSPYTVVTDPEA